MNALYERTAQRLAQFVIFGFFLVTVGVFFLAEDHIQIVVGAWIGLAATAVKEFFGQPGPGNGNQSGKEGEHH